MTEAWIMKKLTKIKLINWHGFYDETIPVSGDILITGENGCGKSTALDAIYFLLSGGETNTFNSAANENACRTVETYMRGKIGVEGKEYLRNDASIISHIALEFTDDGSKDKFVLGVVLEIQEGKTKPGRSFYHIKDRGLREEDYYYVNQNGKKVYCNFRAIEKNLGDTIEDISGSKADVRKSIYSVLGLENKKYFELLPKAIAFKPIPDVNNFVYQFLMPQKDVEIDNIKNIIRNYNDIQSKIKEDIKKKEDLYPIVQSGDLYNDTIKEQSLVEAYNVKHDIDLANKRILGLKEALETNNRRLEALNENESSTKKDIDKIKEKIYAIENNNAYSALKEIENDLKVVASQLDEAKKNDSKFTQKIIDEDSLLTKLEIKANLSKYIRSKDFDGLMDALNSSHKQYDDKRNELSSHITELTNKVSQSQKSIQDLSRELEELNKGRAVYSYSVSSLIDVIKKGIVNNDNNEVSVRPLCELIDIQEGEEEWRDAIEGYLNTRRFDLFVSTSNYDKALSLYEKEKFEKKISGVGLVNTLKIKESDYLPNSLASKIVCNDEDARRYVNYLLGHVICVSNENELKNYESSITKTVMVYQNKAARQTRFEVYKVPYVGSGSRQIRIKQVKDKIDELTQILDCDNRELARSEALRRATSDSSYAFLINQQDVWQIIDTLSSKKQDLEEQYKELKPSCNKLIIEKETFEKNKVELENKLDTIEKSILDVSYECSSNKKDITSLEKSKEELEPRLSDLMNNQYVKLNLDSYVRDHPMNKEQIKNKLSENESKIESLKIDIIRCMTKYCSTHGFDSSPELDSLDDFYTEYNNVILRDLEKYNSQLETVKNRAVVTFQNEYISKIQQNIRVERENIRKLNSVLSDKPFGSNGEIYKFEITRSKDLRLGDYYDIFMSNENYINTQKLDLFTEELSDKHMKLMQELFNRLTDENSSGYQQEKQIMEFTDYRRFMNYDIIITNKDGEQSRFSKINREKSGGETQTPFYVIIAASFDQIVHGSYQKRSPGCIVMFDEAFNNMDESRIDSMMKFFQKLDIQPIIAVPTQRARTIMPYVDTTIALIKTKNRIIPRVTEKIK